MADAPTSALASAETPEPNLQQVDSIVAAAVAAAEAELQAVEEGAAPAVPGAEREGKLSAFEEEDMAASLMSNPTVERSGVALTNWERFARPVELAILSLVMLLLVVGRAGLDWARVGAGMSGLRACVRLEPPRPRCALSRALSAALLPHRLCASQQRASLLAAALELRARRGGGGLLRARRCRRVGSRPERRRAPRRRATRCRHLDAGAAQARQARPGGGRSGCPRCDVRARHAAHAAVVVGSAPPSPLPHPPGLRCQSEPRPRRRRPRRRRRRPHRSPAACSY